MDDKEMLRWQEAIRELIIKRSGAPDDSIDGAGCDSGDPLDFTLTEITQAFYFLDEQSELNRLAEQKRCAQICVQEYARWKDLEADSYGIAIGAVGAASNILCAIEGIPSMSDEPIHENETALTAD